MQGNVWEWCQDVYSAASYKLARDTDPLGPAADGDSPRVIRGGSWVYPARACRSAHRDWLEPDDRIHNSLGFRVASAQD
jgi:formylglycine-generating enzyme required for sulfatase activity